MCSIYSFEYYNVAPFTTFATAKLSVWHIIVSIMDSFRHRIRYFSAIVAPIQTC